MLARHSLKGTVLPIISVDEYMPKSGTQEEVIVIAFYTIDEDPAFDLDDFIEKSFIEVLDVDVSPNPDENGNYLVFVELKRKAGFFEKFYKIIKDVENVSGKQDWLVKAYLCNELLPYNDERLLDYIILLGDEEASITESVISMLTDSDISSAHIDDSRIYISNSHRTVSFEPLYIGETAFNSLKLNECAIELSNVDSNVALLSAFLGKKWEVYKLNEYIILQHQSKQPIIAKL
ncbi:hypothetical protein RVBP17_2070 [Pseudomonas phage sp. 30-3]|nr:hypothetical protein GBBBJNDB_00138 [Pseudomonas phage Callisto]BDR26164.1 hypothetical protein RVBP17_2070 [Pseudomonas phage sp. 30-3]